MNTREKAAVWDAIDRALHDVLVQFPPATLKWLAEETETTSLLQDKANEVLDFIDPVQRAAADGIGYDEAVDWIQENIESARRRAAQS